jgi:hypothetical protein
VKFAVNLAPFNEWSNPRLVAELAREAEAAGWDGFFVWDHMNWNRWTKEIGDPWVALSAAALSTQKVRLGTLVTPLFRRRPVVLARQLSSLQQLCSGRLILGVGLGAPDPQESAWIGEPAERKLRARITDEALELLGKLWSGEPVDHQGEFFQVRSEGFWPRPEPAIPIWIAATYPFRSGPIARGCRHQGLIPAHFDRALAAHELAPLAFPGQDLAAGAYTGKDPAADRARVQSYQEVGVTWWVEPLDPWRADTATLRQRLRAGPPI